MSNVSLPQESTQRAPRGVYRAESDGELRDRRAECLTAGQGDDEPPTRPIAIASVLIAYIDGGARPNPGPAGFGVRIEQPNGILVEEFSEFIGTATNNVAEYRGLLAALEWARMHGIRELHVRSDSLLLVQQMCGNYRVANAGLLPLHTTARQLVGQIGRVTFEHVARSRNAHADRLASAAVDRSARAEAR